MSEPHDWKSLVDTPEEWPKLSWKDPRLTAFAAVVEERYGLPTGVINALKYAEATPAQSSGRSTVSHAKARGIMQFTDSTRKLQGGRFDHDVNDPFQSIDMAGQFMVELMKENKGNVRAAVAGYNGGPRQAKPVREGKDPPTAETQSYLKAMEDFMEAYTKARGTK